MSSASTPYLAGFLFIWGRVSVPMSTYETVPWGSNHLLLNGIGSLGHIMTKDKGYVCWSVNPSSVQLHKCISLHIIHIHHKANSSWRNIHQLSYSGVSSCGTNQKKRSTRVLRGVLFKICQNRTCEIQVNPMIELSKKNHGIKKSY